MRYLPALALALCGCRSLLGVGEPVDDDAPTPDAPTAGPFSTGPIVPILCTGGGMPGDPGCPINLIPLPIENGSRFEFVAVAEMLSITLIDMKLQGGPLGVSLSHPRLLGYPVGSQQGLPDPGDTYVNVVADLAPGTARALPGSVILQSDQIDRIGIQFDTLRPFGND